MKHDDYSSFDMFSFVQELQHLMKYKTMYEDLLSDYNKLESDYNDLFSSSVNHGQNVMSGLLSLVINKDIIDK